jgi:lycopene cyclase domain-containing protein
VSYTLLSVAGVGAAVLVDQLVLRTDLLRRKAFWTSYAIVCFFQLIVNGLLTGLRVVRYDADRIIGWRIVYAPVEDLLFGFAMVTMTLSLWVWWGRRAVRAGRREVP